MRARPDPRLALDDEAAALADAYALIFAVRRRRLAATAANQRCADDRCGDHRIALADEVNQPEGEEDS